MWDVYYVRKQEKVCFLLPWCLEACCLLGGDLDYRLIAAYGHIGDPAEGGLSSLSQNLIFNFIRGMGLSWHEAYDFMETVPPDTYAHTICKRIPKINKTFQ